MEGHIQTSVEVVVALVAEVALGDLEAVVSVVEVPEEVGDPNRFYYSLLTIEAIASLLFLTCKHCLLKNRNIKPSSSTSCSERFLSLL
jgi:hypothetical protein